MAAQISGEAFAALRRLRRWRVRDWAQAAAPMLVVAAVAYLRFTSPPPALSLASYERIALGMSAEEVEGVVRTRPGGYGPFWGPGETAWEGSAEPAWWVGWSSPAGLLSVGYGEDGRVCCKRLEYHPGAIPPYPERWSVWRRLVERSVPAREASAIYSPF